MFEASAVSALLDEHTDPEVAFVGGRDWTARNHDLQ